MPKPEHNDHSSSVPKKTPEKGFYYHYKHDPAGPVNNYAYEFVGVGFHTEPDCRPEDQHLALYLPLYESAFVYKNGKMFDARPLEMWMGTLEKEGKTVSRFTRITDEAVIQELETIRKKMYD
jgi:hypothetical protein